MIKVPWQLILPQNMMALVHSFLVSKYSRLIKLKHPGTTSIFSLDLHFYDEAYEHLTLPGDFEQYISKYDRRLQAAVENRFKVNRI